MHANSLHKLMLTGICEGKCSYSVTKNKKLKVGAVLCHSLQSIHQKQTHSEKSPPAVIPTLQTLRVFFLLF